MFRRGEKLEIIIQFQKAGGLNLVRGLLDDDDYYDIGEDLSFITQKKGPFSYSLSHNFLGILLLQPNDSTALSNDGVVRRVRARP